MSSLERDNPPPRRKSCEACRAAKRRCNLALPACFRCSQRGLACIYPGLPPDQIPELLELLNEPEQSKQFNFDAAVLGFPAVEAVQPPPLQYQPQDTAAVVYNDQQGMTRVRTSNPVLLSALMSSRFEYPVDILKDVPRRMVMENQTPWSHPKLYSSGMPKVMQGTSPALLNTLLTATDAYACCALYITKNRINGPMITSHIHSRHQELALSPLPTTPTDLLAHAHALILYQIMHLFDADLNAADTAVSLDILSISALQSTTSLLFSSTHFPHTQQPNQQPPTLHPTTTLTFWTLWILEESARRSIIVALFLIQVLRIFRGDTDLHCDGKLGVLHSWYFSAHLWTAASAYEFATAWSEKRHFIVHNADFDQVLEEAEPGDVDCLGKMLLVTSRGVDVIRDWFFRRGAIL